ncbi:acyl-CoA N-acyltransferase [Coemansia reversa NRRL 1564]|uniref:Acyl-CoA N-acyltransferase n=1 Tax=Coemansia reversa (strain ATCC 12441 / NRRL 1564) TaxID=763665 RepID=A0A2G5BAH9_COERN|nr:acyl-CoA N-acyltransferase [Coemansia reversa NRRL 1564]|eukprot:PIA15727.1 acyl-CoA N-acyltransferase [Coemansia reversa NRRL 1564]
MHKTRSMLPSWYAESRFLQGEAQRTLSDSTDCFIFGRMFKTPTNPSYQDGNHLLVSFCHLEFPWDYNGTLADPPRGLPQIVASTYYQHALFSPSTASPPLPRCIIDCTIMEPKMCDIVIEEFELASFVCERGIVDKVMCLTLTDRFLSTRTLPRLFSGDLHAIIYRVVDQSDVGLLSECYARCFGYDQLGDTSWLFDKLLRQILNHHEFLVFAARAGRNDDFVAFVVVYTPVERAPDLAFVQVLGTHPDYRRRGLAAAVLTRALKCLPPGSRVYLDAYKPSAISLYQKIGFEQVGEIVSAQCTLPIE